MGAKCGISDRWVFPYRSANSADWMSAARLPVSSLRDRGLDGSTPQSCGGIYRLSLMSSMFGNHVPPEPCLDRTYAPHDMVAAKQRLFAHATGEGVVPYIPQIWALSVSSWVAISFPAISGVAKQVTLRNIDRIKCRLLLSALWIASPVVRSLPMCLGFPACRGGGK